jgi:nitrogen PTS system EIIA component
LLDNHRQNQEYVHLCPIGKRKVTIEDIMQLRVKDVSQLLSVSEKTVYRWVRQNSLPGYRVNNQYRFNRAELLEWATTNKINVSADLFSEPESEKMAAGSLFEAVKLGGIHYRVGGKDKASAIRSVVELMNLPPEVDREFLYSVLLAREALASTGIGEGIAIPHVRNPIVLHVPGLMVNLCFLEQPVDFGAIDSKPVDCLFAVISPTVRAHLKLLSRLGYALRDTDFKAALKNQASREEILNHLKRIDAEVDRTKTP